MFIEALIENEDIQKSNTLNQFLIIEEPEKFVQFQELKIKQNKLGSKLKPVLKIFLSGTGNHFIFTYNYIQNYNHKRINR